jgi:hypothetical protein
MLPLLDPLKAACVIVATNFAAKFWITANWRVLFANRILRHAFFWPSDTTHVKELADGHAKQDADFKRHRATQLNESEWTATLLPICLYLAATVGGGCTS